MLYRRQGSAVQEQKAIGQSSKYCLEKAVRVAARRTMTGPLDPNSKVKSDSHVPILSKVLLTVT
jgi:hypothetical protein